MNRIEALIDFQSAMIRGLGNGWEKAQMAVSELSTEEHGNGFNPATIAKDASMARIIDINKGTE